MTNTPPPRQTQGPPPHSAALPPAYVAPSGRRLVPGIAFAGLAGGRPLELDLHLPPSTEGPTPVVVFVHGGGWRLGNRASVGPAYAADPLSPFEAMTTAGLAVASIDYRLSGETQWPSQLHDVKAAVRWLRRRGPELGLSPGPMAAWGESAGGHLASLLGLTDARHAGDLGLTDPAHPELDDPVAAVVAWYAPSDLLAIAPASGADPDAEDSREAQLLGTALTRAPETAREASPVSHVGPGAPPFLLLHGEADAFVPCDQSRRLHRALTEVGSCAELVTYPGAGHLWNGSPAAASDALERTLRFLEHHLIH